jgi:hypothetical protein
VLDIGNTSVGYVYTAGREKFLSDTGRIGDASHLQIISKLLADNFQK